MICMCVYVCVYIYIYIYINVCLVYLVSHPAALRFDPYIQNSTNKYSTALDSRNNMWSQSQ